MIMSLMISHPRRTVNGAIGHVMLATEFHLDLAREEGPHQVGAVLNAAAKLFDAANAMGWVEHTSDWDPFLIITLNDDTKLRTPSHFYLILNEDLEKDKNWDLDYLEIEAPEWLDVASGIHEADAAQPIYQYYVREVGDKEARYRIPIKDIKHIKADPQ